jgi:hypothetical protein
MARSRKRLRRYDDDGLNNEDIEGAALSQFHVTGLKSNNEELIDLISDSDDEKMDVVTVAVSNVEDSKKEQGASTSSDKSNDLPEFANALIDKLIAKNSRTHTFSRFKYLYHFIPCTQYILVFF